MSVDTNLITSVVLIFLAMIALKLAINVVFWLILLPFRLIRGVSSVLFQAPCDWMNSLFDTGGRRLFRFATILPMVLVYFAYFSLSRKPESQQIAVPAVFGLIALIFLGVWLRYSLSAAIVFVPMIHVFSLLWLCHLVLSLPADTLEELPEALTGFLRILGERTCEYCGCKYDPDRSSCPNCGRCR